MEVMRFPNTANRLFRQAGNGVEPHTPDFEDASESQAALPKPASPTLAPVPEEPAQRQLELPANQQKEPEREGPRKPPIEAAKPPIPVETSQPAVSPSRATSTPRDPLQALKVLLEQNSSLPTNSVVLGVCEDGLPLALDVTDPTPGALLVMGDNRDEQIRLLQTIVASACLRNSPRAVQFLVFTHQPDAWRAWVNENGFERHCITVAPAQEESIRDWILQLADWTEQRRLGQRSGPPILLVIDTLYFVPRLAYDIRLNFDWMVKEGPPAQIWTVAGISTELASSLGSRMLRSFQSRILGFAKDPEVYVRIAGLEKEHAATFNQPEKFSVQAGERWLEFQLPGV
jgi:hypothetical protein